MMTNEEAIKTLHELWRETNDSWYEEAFRIAVEALKTDRPHGEWMIDTYNMELRCGICGETFRFDDVDELLDYKEYAKYCLACGARMI